MSRKQWALPAVGAALFTFSIFHIVRAQQTRGHPPPQAAAALPGGERIAGTGVVEPSSENISVGSHRPGIVSEIFVRTGDSVERGAPLFCLDDRAARADVRAREADLAMARSRLERLLRMPRAEELPPLVARLGQAKAKLDDAEDKLQRASQLVAARALPEEQAVRARQEREFAFHALRAVQAELDLKRAGAWGPDRKVAAAAVKQAESQLDRARTELDLLCARAPVAATVLRIDVRTGERVTVGPSASFVTLGVTRPLHVRVDLDEAEIPRFRLDAPARAVIRGSGEVVPLELVRLEPAVIPKRSLSGASAERLDTRVLQVLYRVAATTPRMFVGQQVDVTVDLAPSR